MKTFSKEWFIDAPWGKIAMISCGNPNGEPVLLVHGREDSVATFIPLLRLLSNQYNYVGFDLPGHGKSEPFPTGVMMTRFHFVAAVDVVVKHLAWRDFVFMSHSLGGELGLFFNIIRPNLIKKFIHIDIIPALESNQERPWPALYTTFYNEYYDNYDKYNNDNRVYTKRRAMDAVKKARGLTEEQAELILSRNLIKIGDDQYKLSWDRRLKIPAPINLRKEFFFDIISKNPPPTLFIHASNTKSTYPDAKDTTLQLVKDLKDNLKNFYYVYVEGRHDVHVTHPERISEYISKFLSKEFVSAKI